MHAQAQEEELERFSAGLVALMVARKPAAMQEWARLLVAVIVLFALLDMNCWDPTSDAVLQDLVEDVSADPMPEAEAPHGKEVEALEPVPARGNISVPSITPSTAEVSADPAVAAAPVLTPNEGSPPLLLPEQQFSTTWLADEASPLQSISAPPHLWRQHRTPLLQFQKAQVNRQSRVPLRHPLQLSVTQISRRE